MKKGNRGLQARLNNFALARDGKKAAKPGVTFSVSASIGEGRDTSETLPAGFNIWTSTFKDLSDLVASGRISLGGPVAAQWFCATALNERREKIIAEGPELMRALSIVARQGLVMPEWMSAAYLSRYSRIEKFEVASFDDAFGPLPYKPGARFEQFKKRRREIPLLSRALVAALVADPSRPIDNGLFEEVGSMFGMAKTRAQELYWEGVREQGLQNLADLKEVLLSGR